MAHTGSTTSVRPYQLMCVVCKLGAGASADLGQARLTELLRAVRERPYLALTVRCNTTGGYHYQNPGREDDTPEGALYNVKRDLNILQRMGLAPGSTLPAKELFSLLFGSVPTARGVCGYGQPTSEAWRGCAEAESGNYERGHAAGIGVVFPPRTEEEKARVKAESAAAVGRAERLAIFPHHLMCLTCFYGGHLDDFAPIAEDNLFEVIDAIHRQPDIPITLVRSSCMICPPCSVYDPATSLCYTNVGQPLRNEQKDLDTLQALGLEYGDTLPARQLFRLLYERVPSTREICGYRGTQTSPVWRICGAPEGDPRYARGRAAGLGFLSD